jgi:hypothetical protein
MPLVHWSVTRKWVRLHFPSSFLSVVFSFFGNHPVVISVFLVSGMAIAGLVAISLYCCHLRKRKRQTQRRENVLQDISPPLHQNLWTIREHSPYGRWDRFARPGNQAVPTQNLGIPLDRSEDSLPKASTIIDAPPPLPPLPAQNATSRSSHRVPVRYAALGAHGSNLRTADWQYTDPFHYDRPPMPAVQTVPSPNVPPPLPTRSPLRSAAKNGLSLPQEEPKRVSRASSQSLYPPSSHPSEAEVDSLYQKEVAPSRSPGPDASGLSARGLLFGNNSGMEQKREKASEASRATGLKSMNSDDESLSWQARYSAPENPASRMGTARTSILGEKVYRTLPLPQARDQRAALFKTAAG